MSLYRVEVSPLKRRGADFEVSAVVCLGGLRMFEASFRSQHLAILKSTAAGIVEKARADFPGVAIKGWPLAEVFE